MEGFLITYGEVKKQALELAFDYSIAGAQIPGTYNNQDDYLCMIPQLVNSAQMEIATTVKKIPAMVNVDTLTKDLGETREIYNLPTDFYKIMDGGFLLLDDRGGKRIKKYRIINNKKLFMPDGINNDMILEYWRFPTKLESNVADSTELDNTVDTHYAVPFYVAAHLLLYDDAYRYAVLLNEWETRLARLRENMFVERGLVRNDYA